VFKYLMALLFVSSIAIAEEKKTEDTCMPFILSFNMLKEQKYVPFLRKRTEGRVDELIYSPRTKRGIHIWYFQPDETKLPITLCLGKVYEDFKISDDFAIAVKEWLINPEVEL